MRRGWTVYARSTTFMARPESIDAGVAEVRDQVMPRIQRMEGCVGLSMLADRESGRCIATSAWRSEEAMRASDEELRPVRDRVGEMLGASPQVDEWEIAVLHRDHRSAEGACVRVTWVRVDPADMDRAIDVYKLASLPRAEELAGFCSASLLVDRSSGRAVSSVTYDSIAAMENNREAAASMRSAASKDAGAEVLDTGEFELAVAHLRVPEMT
ncbi:MAG TPA: antibiotic biosynthesis monooxygenase [Kribbella sp.]|uniref:putative quinol monooxygenase n=1 Tax=Kribbella sp. TaxID=1871183 RepID=UPI002D788130|nr:antibiotic biosynthesis monooxygenase [Kribbella sp.]HET6292166.1 antibiotic biosynthesis monooxygenase [Kribbella sp.]